MVEPQVLMETPYTYTYDQFTVFFYGGHVFIGKKEYPVGQCCVDILNLDGTVLEEINQRVKVFVPAAQSLLTEKTDSAAALAQERLNAVWELIFSLPVYRDLNMDEPCNYHTFQRLMAHEDKWAQVQDPASKGYAKYQGMISSFADFVDSLRKFRNQISVMTEKYFEPLKRRNSSTYAEAYSRFYADMLTIDAWLYGEDFEQSFSMQVNFVPMAHPTEEGKIFVAEKSTFNSLADFLRTEFYRGLAIGNAPRRCHNCGRYFLLTSSYNICYCNNIAPGETRLTCRKVGAHRKEAQGKEHRTPAQKEYERTYNRLKTRKQRGKISVDEWNAAVARAQAVLDLAERGELTDEETRRQFETF